MTTYWLVAVAAFPIIATVIVGEAKQVAPIDPYGPFRADTGEEL